MIKRGGSKVFCSKCGKEIVEGVAFCQHCGNPVNASENASEPVKNNAGSFFRSLQEKAKGVSESINTAAEEAQKKVEEEKKEQAEKIKMNANGKQVKANQQPIEKSYRRFQSTNWSEGLIGLGGHVIVDRLTGVNYLYARLSNAGGLTVLVDENGKPLVTKEDKIEITDTEENEQNNAE